MNNNIENVGNSGPNRRFLRAVEITPRDDTYHGNIKLLDIALENGTLNKSVQEKEKKKVRFFKDNFPGGEY